MHTSDAGLIVDSLVVNYGAITALAGVSLRVTPGEVVAVLGPNGAGKSTLLRAISGLVRPTAGHVLIDGNEITGRRPHTITRAGVSHVPEGRRVLAPLTVEENLQLAARAAHLQPSGGTVTLEQIYDLFPRLAERKRQTSGLLSGGEQQMLAIGRGLIANPSVLMLDEPSMGLAPIVIEEIYELLGNRTGPLSVVAILLAEQTATMALDVADRAIVLALGEVRVQGTPDELRNDERLFAAYLGNSQT